MDTKRSETMDIDTLEAGRELDALVAEKVMGWKYSQNAPEGCFCKSVGNDKGWWKYPGLKGWACGPCSDLPPHYSTDIAAAWAPLVGTDPDPASNSPESISFLRPSSSLTTSLAVWKRLSGFFSRQRSMILPR